MSTFLHMRSGWMQYIYEDKTDEKVPMKEEGNAELIKKVYNLSLMVDAKFP